jgi:hypothetical protein
MSFNIPYAQGGTRKLLMPRSINDNNRINLKPTIGSVTQSGVAAFYTALQLDFSDSLMEAATLQVLADTTEQTLVDTGTGVEGVLTQLMCARLSAAGTAIIRITIDGTETVYSQVVNDSLATFCIGDFLSYHASATGTPQYGGSGNSGYEISSSKQATMISPIDSLSRGLPIGLPFEDSLKITVQGSVNFLAGSSTHKAAASWLTFIPEGVL